MTDETDEPRGEQGAFEWADRPALRLGDRFRLDVHAWVQTNMRLHGEAGSSTDQFWWGNRRVGVEGVLFKRVEFQIERELRDTRPWRDVFADARLHRSLRIRAGRFKVPFSMERTTSAFDLDFIARATPVADMAPGRENGLMAHGRAVRRLLEYEVGVFRLAGNLVEPIAPLTGESPKDVKMAAGRLIVTPTPDLRLGLAVAGNRLPEGLQRLADHFAINKAVPSEAYYVNGQRRRVGLEGLWNAGRLSLKGELIHQADSRQGEDVTGGDLSDLIVRGGYLSGVWRLAGAPGKARRAVDLAVRFDRLEMGSGNQTDAPSTSRRTNHVPPLHKDTWTVGVNWMVNRWVKVQANGVREQLVDPLGIRQRVLAPSWSSALRVQFAM